MNEFEMNEMEQAKRRLFFPQCLVVDEKTLPRDLDPEGEFTNAVALKCELALVDTEPEKEAAKAAAQDILAKEQLQTAPWPSADDMFAQLPALMMGQKELFRYEGLRELTGRVRSTEEHLGDEPREMILNLAALARTMDHVPEQLYEHYHWYLVWIRESAKKVCSLDVDSITQEEFLLAYYSLLRAISQKVLEKWRWAPRLKSWREKMEDMRKNSSADPAVMDAIALEEGGLD
ncbi:MAG: hypothetical protein IJ083_11095 [Clostridia bacterium]|nr:hypothetical protein [Clostridia bacterium]